MKQTTEQQNNQPHKHRARALVRGHELTRCVTAEAVSSGVCVREIEQRKWQRRRKRARGRVGDNERRSLTMTKTNKDKNNTNNDTDNKNQHGITARSLTPRIKTPQTWERLSLSMNSHPVPHRREKYAMPPAIAMANEGVAVCRPHAPRGPSTRGHTAAAVW